MKTKVSEKNEDKVNCDSDPSSMINLDASSNSQLESMQSEFIRAMMTMQEESQSRLKHQRSQSKLSHDKVRTS